MIFGAVVAFMGGYGLNLFDLERQLRYACTDSDTFVPNGLGFVVYCYF